MNDELKILIWDDELGQIYKLISCINGACNANGWTHIKVVSPIELFGEKKVYPYKDFEEYLLKNHKLYKLLIMDITDKTMNNVAELALPNLMRENAELDIIVTTLRKNIPLEEIHSLYFAGKCKAVRKTQLWLDVKDNGITSLLAYFLNLKPNLKNVVSGLNLEIENDIQLQFIIESFGGFDTFKFVIFSLKDMLHLNLSTAKLKVELINQGHSGASVLKLQIVDNGIRYRLIKISKDRDALVSELNKVKNEYEYIPKPFRIDYFVDNVVNVPGYEIWVLIGEFSESLGTLRNKISSSSISIEYIKDLMINCLKEITFNHQKEMKNLTPGHEILHIFDARRLSFLKASCIELAPLTKGEDTLPDSILKILDRIKKGEIFNYRTDYKHVLTHGDFHSNNILVVDKNLKIIDAANMNYANWTKDICKLVVDIFSFGIDAKTKDYFSINRISKWYDMGVQILEGKQLKAKNGNSGVIEILNWVCDENNLRLVFGELYSKWEYQLSLGAEFLRISFKYDQLPHGKRAACLLIGKEALNLAEQSYKNLGKGVL